MGLTEITCAYEALITWGDGGKKSQKTEYSLTGVWLPFPLFCTRLRSPFQNLMVPWARTNCDLGFMHFWLVVPFQPM